MTRDEHTVKISTFGDTTQYNFTHEIDPENPNGVEVPRITEASVGNAVVDGKQSAVVNVTVENPSRQTYPTKLMVHTEGTDGSYYPAIASPGENETITVELLDAPDAEIVGQARLYTGDFEDPEGELDQVGFVGRVDGETEQWNESFEPVAPPWSDDPYQYRNASAGDSPGLAEQVSGGVELGGVPVAYLVGGAVVAAGIVGLVRR